MCPRYSPSPARPDAGRLANANAPECSLPFPGSVTLATRPLSHCVATAASPCQKQGLRRALLTPWRISSVLRPVGTPAFRHPCHPELAYPGRPGPLHRFCACIGTLAPPGLSAIHQPHCSFGQFQSEIRRCPLRPVLRLWFALASRCSHRPEPPTTFRLLFPNNLQQLLHLQPQRAQTWDTRLSSSGLEKREREPPPTPGNQPLRPHSMQSSDSVSISLSSLPPLQ